MGCAVAWWGDRTLLCWACYQAFLWQSGHAEIPLVLQHFHPPFVPQATTTTHFPNIGLELFAVVVEGPLKAGGLSCLKPLLLLLSLLLLPLFLQCSLHLLFPQLRLQQLVCKQPTFENMRYKTLIILVRTWLVGIRL